MSKVYAVFARHPTPTEPSQAQIEAGNYKKRVVRWRGLDIAIENEAGTLRHGKSRAGLIWSRRMHFAYGYAKRSTGVDGDEVDIFLGPNLEAPMVYVIHQRKAGDWKAYDEDKAMVGFDSPEDAEAAYLSCYNDPRFLGPMTAIPADEFVAKVRATKEAPAMIKSCVIVFR